MELRLSPLLVALILSNIQLVVVSAKRVDVQVLENRALFGYNLLNLTGTTALRDCLPRCLQNCKCMSFQVCNETCQLSSSNKEISPNALKEAQGCSYFSFQDLPQGGNRQCEQGVSDVITISCCLSSNPCEHDGICVPVYRTKQTRRRYRCQCSGYTGARCQTAIKSCRGYRNGIRIPGIYKILDANNKPFEVFCDFDTKSNMTWTLIQSYQFQHNARFNTTPFTVDNPVNENRPVWDEYRLSKSRMESIQSDSSRWRMTCRYDSDGLNLTDYVEVDNSTLDILTYDGAKCIKVEYINIRGHNCTSCTANVGHADSNGNWALHFDSYNGNKSCTFKLQGSVNNEDNFGFYASPNPAHRCSSSPTSTSQTWFGGF